jgi:predicted RNA-binding Zn-ribbon protein involved in translation (DUF1610 family)
MLVSGIKSRPQYPGLTPDRNARSNLVVCDQAGAEAVIEMMKEAGAAFAQKSTVLLLDEGSEPTDASLVERLQPAASVIHHRIESIQTQLSGLLQGAKMGVRVYVAGSEPLIGSVVQTAMQQGIDHRSVRSEHRGSLKRRVQCVHCKGMIEDVTVNPVQCPHCGLHLLVRDHYSRRFAAFQGVCVNAEEPSEIPEQKVEFP